MSFHPYYNSSPSAARRIAWRLPHLGRVDASPIYRKSDVPLADVVADLLHDVF